MILSSKAVSLQEKQILNMDIDNIKERWDATLLETLKALMSICEQYHLRYYCAFGTVLGAIRHKGIIPWDDDIDVVMPRPDYNRLLEIAKTADFGDYGIVTPDSDENYPLIFSKIIDRRTTLVEDKHFPCVIGLYVDIFPIDGTADDIGEARRLRAKYVKLVNRLNAVSSHYTFGEYLSLLTNPAEWGRFVYKTMAWIARGTMRRNILKKMNEISALYDYDKAKTIQFYSGGYGNKEIVPKEWFAEGVIVPFESIEIRIPKEYDKYLSNFYGDYMQLPPVEKRAAHHHRAYLNIDRRETKEEIRKKVGFRI